MQDLSWDVPSELILNGQTERKKHLLEGRKKWITSP
jgi:hypothetical protein